MSNILTRRGFLGSASAAAAGLALPRSALPAAPGAIAVANRVSAVNLTVAFKGPATLNARVRHTLTTEQPVTGLQLVYSNWALTASGKQGEVDGPSPLTFHAALEIDGRVHRLSFDGAPEAACAPGEDVVTDPLDLSVAAGGVVFSRVFFSGGSDRFPRPLPIYREWAEYIEILGGAADKTTATSGLPNFNTTAGYGPSAILGIVARRQPAIAIIGDSIANGNSGGDNAITPTDNLGYIARGIANRYGFIRLTIPQDSLFAFTVDNRRRMRLLAGRVSHAICAHGINDVSVGRPFEQIRAKYLEQWSALTAHGIKVFQCTLTPRTDSSDDHATPRGPAPGARLRAGRRAREGQRVDPLDAGAARRLFRGRRHPRERPQLRSLARSTERRRASSTARAACTRRHTGTSSRPRRST